MGGRSEGKQRALVGGGWGELKMSQDLPPQRLGTKLGLLIRRRAWGSLSSVFQLSPLSPLAFIEHLHCAAQDSLLWGKRIHPTGEAFEWIPSSRADGGQFALCSKFWELGNFGPLHFFATNVPKMSGGLSGRGFLVSKIKGLNSNNTEELL